MVLRQSAGHMQGEVQHQQNAPTRPEAAAATKAARLLETTDPVGAATATQLTTSCMFCCMS
jgi:hypothetical protein